jgi:bifunctional UDP-N-acetylglucosamine pyrophosphorylase/glucosamine-1-phosphate N-acetyltransferase
VQSHTEATAREIAVVVLAAGKGTRMKSARAKVLHGLCGIPMLGHIQKVAEAVSAARLIVVIGRDADEVRRIYGESAEFVLQAEQKGTGHAVMMTEDALRDFSGDVFILYGDTPLLRPETLERMRVMKAETGADLVMLTASGDIPGRVLRGEDGRVMRIVEAQDATADELAIEERNTGVYLVSSDLLWAGLGAIDTDNQQGELYITDVVGYAVEKGYRVEALWLDDASECLGINDRTQLAEATRIMRDRINARIMADGVTLIDPETTYIDATVEIGQDSVIEPGCVITGRTLIGRGSHIKANCTIEDSILDDDVQLGPYAHLRPHSHLMKGVKIGNFVEIKNSTLGPGSKSAHLTYIGDADVGADVNFGCGSVVVNYDGYRKHRSTVGDSAFIGCNVNLVSPVRISPHAFLAAGSTITSDVPEDALAVGRARQRNIDGWVARKEGRPFSRPARTDATPAASEQPGRPVTAREGPPVRKTTRKQSTKTKKASRKQSGRKSAKKKASRKKAATAGKSGRVKSGSGKTAGRPNPKKNATRRTASGTKHAKGGARRTRATPNRTRAR